jgi:hypothetical protein
MWLENGSMEITPNWSYEYGETFIRSMDTYVSRDSCKNLEHLIRIG